MAGSRPAQSRAENVPQLSAERKATLLRAMGLGGGSASLVGLQKQLRADPGYSPHQPAMRQAAPVRASLAPMAPPPPADPGEAIKAGLRGAADSLPFGIVDRALAAGHAVIDASRGASLGSAYDRRLEAERAQDRYDMARHHTARMVGEVTGNLVQTALPMLGAARVARIAQTTPMLLSEALKLAGGGALANAGLESVVDAATGQRITAAKLIGSGAGGALGTFMALRGKPGAAGAATGAATSLAQDVLSGNMRSWDDLENALERASGAAAAGSAAGFAGKRAASWAEKLPSQKPGGKYWQSKKDLGEHISKLRTRLRGDRVTGEEVPINLKKGFTRADHVTALDQVVEAKFGKFAKLRKKQLEAYEQFKDRYRVDHFLPRDIGAAAELPLGAFIYQGRNLADGPSR